MRQRIGPRMIGRPHRTRVLPALTFSAVLLVAGTTNHVAAQLALVARQPDLLGQALASLQAATPGQPNLYFIGFAGFGRQAVFKREVLAVRQLFDDRFNTRGRSLSLINHSSTSTEVPLANVTNLNKALQHVAKLMDPDRDLLFLFLTSHGRVGRFDVEMPGVRLKPLKPEQLRELLDRAGIKRRVIVVSSCHSGSFISALTGPTSLVIAAARADRSSFGCEDRRRWTYFGDAFFNRALREETSFRRAFSRARRLIDLWEARDQLTPSLPQIAGGEALTEID
jgi:hypothetical protein